MAPKLLKLRAIAAQFRQCSLRHDAPLFQDIHVIEGVQKMKAMERRNHRLPRKSLEQSLVNERFRLRIDTAGGFVEQNHFTL